MATDPVTSQLKILMFPWLGYGHIAANLKLAKKLADRGLSMYICSTPVNNVFIKKKISGRYSDLIQLVELHLPHIPELPPHYHTCNGLPPHLMSTLHRAMNRAKPELSNILKNLKPDLVIYDIILKWTAALTAAHNIPAVEFAITSATALAHTYHLFRKPELEFPFPAIHISDFEMARLGINPKDPVVDAEESDHPPSQMPNRFCYSILLAKSSREIEGKYMDYLSDITGMKIVPVSILFQEPVDDDEDDINDELIQWLGTKSECSTVFVSFGSEYFLTKEEMEEIAYGLEFSHVNFIWVVRFPLGQNIRPEEALPEGFSDRVGDRGRIVEGWASQAKILQHPSIGGFVCHCGWNSVAESIGFRVPIIAIPMKVDQPINARLVVEIGVGVEASRDGNGKLDRHVIAKVLQDVVTKDVGENVRRKLRDVSEKIKLSENQDLDQAVDLLTQHVKENTHPSK